uniref:hypothetical protein n=1 Tax=Streptosporangium sp. CA-235898 TaxID=3240073 RepID=UPI003F492480
MPKIRSALAVLALAGALVACVPAEGASEETAPEPTCSAEETVPEAEALPVEDYDNAAAVGDC